MTFSGETINTIWSFSYGCPQQLHGRKWYLNELAKCKALHFFFPFPSYNSTLKQEALCFVISLCLQIERRYCGNSTKSKQRMTEATLTQKNIICIFYLHSSCNLIDFLTEFVRSKTNAVSRVQHCLLQWITAIRLTYIRKKKDINLKEKHSFQKYGKGQLFYTLLTFVSLSRC